MVTTESYVLSIFLIELSRHHICIMVNGHIFVVQVETVNMNLMEGKSILLAIRKFRIIDFKRTKTGIEGIVESIQYDPNRSSNLALIKYKDGEWAYIRGSGGKCEYEPDGRGFLIDTTTKDLYFG